MKKPSFHKKGKGIKLNFDQVEVYFNCSIVFAISLVSRKSHTFTIHFMMACIIINKLHLKLTFGKHNDFFLDAVVSGN